MAEALRKVAWVTKPAMSTTTAMKPGSQGSTRWKPSRIWVSPNRFISVYFAIEEMMNVRAMRESTSVQSRA